MSRGYVCTQLLHPPPPVMSAPRAAANPRAWALLCMTQRAKLGQYRLLESGYTWEDLGEYHQGLGFQGNPLL